MKENSPPCRDHDFVSEILEGVDHVVACPCEHDASYWDASFVNGQFALYSSNQVGPTKGCCADSQIRGHENEIIQASLHISEGLLVWEVILIYERDRLKADGFVAAVWVEPSDDRYCSSAKVFHEATVVILYGLGSE